MKKIMTGQSNSKVLVIGVFPPPVTGMTMINQLFTESLENLDIDFKRYNLATSITSRWFFRFYKNLLTFGLAFLIPYFKIVKRYTHCYQPCNAKIGMLSTLLIVFWSKLWRLKCVIHHHSFAYVDDSSIIMNTICRLMSHDDYQIFLCDRHQAKFRTLYSGSYKSAILPNYAYYKDIEAKAMQKSAKSLAIGHLSNLSLAKGIADMIAVYDILATRLEGLKLIIGGPFSDLESKRLIEETQKKHGKGIVYKGALYNNEKEVFFGEIDLFVFPTKYFNEAQPLVLIEAQSRGIPIVSYSRGCINSDIKNGGVVLTENIELMAEEIEKLFLDDNYRFQMKNDAIGNFKELMDKGKEAKHKLVEIFS
ncbi:MAG: glycosyltransferase family 4 protein [Reichenbachiella sp.]